MYTSDSRPKQQVDRRTDRPTDNRLCCVRARVGDTPTRTHAQPALQLQTQLYNQVCRAAVVRLTR